MAVRAGMTKHMKLRFLTSAIAFACCLLLSIASLFAQGTSFTYQGRLMNGANAANGSFDLQFALYDQMSGGVQQGLVLTNAAVAVTNGLFTVPLDFGNQFTGGNRWVEIAVRSNAFGNFTTLTPRQPVSPVPYAITAGSVIGGGNVSGTFTGNGGGLTNLSFSSLAGDPLASNNGVNLTNLQGVAKLDSPNVFHAQNNFNGSTILGNTVINTTNAELTITSSNTDNVLQVRNLSKGGYSVVWGRNDDDFQNWAIGTGNTNTGAPYSHRYFIASNPGPYGSGTNNGGRGMDLITAIEGSFYGQYSQFVGYWFHGDDGTLDQDFLAPLAPANRDPVKFGVNKFGRSALHVDGRTANVTISNTLFAGTVAVSNLVLNGAVIGTNISVTNLSGSTLQLILGPNLIPGGAVFVDGSAYNGLLPCYPLGNLPTNNTYYFVPSPATGETELTDNLLAPPFDFDTLSPVVFNTAASLMPPQQIIGSAAGATVHAALYQVFEIITNSALGNLIIPSRNNFPTAALIGSNNVALVVSNGTLYAEASTGTSTNLYALNNPASANSNPTNSPIPRLTRQQRDALPNPAPGLLIYQTDGTTNAPPGLRCFNGTNWVRYAEFAD